MAKNLVAFIAGDALKNNAQFFVTCNCGQKIELPHPLQYLSCTKCGSSIKPIVLDGNPSGIETGDPQTGQKKMYPVQGYDAAKPETKGWLKVIDTPDETKSKTLQ